MLFKVKLEVCPLSHGWDHGVMKSWTYTLSSLSSRLGKVFFIINFLYKPRPQGQKGEKKKEEERRKKRINIGQKRIVLIGLFFFAFWG